MIWKLKSNKRMGDRISSGSLSIILLSVLVALSSVMAQNTPKDGNPETPREIVQPYDLIDPEYCFLTPSPFLCKRCLLNGMQIARVLRFDEEGRPYREYRCVDFPEYK